MKYTLTVLLGFLLFGDLTAQTTTYSLGTSAILVSPSAGSNSVVLAVSPETGAWASSANATWLHVGGPFQSGEGSTNIVFSVDANLGGTRSGTLTIADQTLTITQAGSTYVLAETVGTLVSTGLSLPYGIGVDNSGNVYIADYEHNAIKEWNAANNSVATLVSTGINGPFGVAVDTAGNIYSENTAQSTIVEWIAANSNLITLVSSGLSDPAGLAVDGSDNVYIASPFQNAVKEWMSANSNVTSLAASGIDDPYGVAVDAAGNVYIADTFHNAVDKWTPGSTNVTTLASTGLGQLYGVAVDGSGNVYIADTVHSLIKEWMAANNKIVTLVSSGLNNPFGVSVNGAGNVYFTDTYNNAVKELPYAFVDPTGTLEGPAAGSDQLPTVLPATINLLTPFAPTSDQSWLTITGVTNGVVGFSYAANSGPARKAHISLLGQTISIIQGLIGTPPTLSSVQALGSGAIQFSFTNNPSASFTVLSTTDISLPLANWTVLGSATNVSSDLFRFTSQPTTGDQQRYFIVRSP